MIIPTPNLNVSIIMPIINLNIILYLPITVIMGSGRFVVSVVLRDSPLSVRVLIIALTVVSSTKLCGIMNNDQYKDISSLYEPEGCHRRECTILAWLIHS
jgi:hypothetical protein